MNRTKSKVRDNRLCNNYKEDGELENESFRGKDYVVPPACNMFEISAWAMGKQYLQQSTKPSISEQSDCTFAASSWSCVLSSILNN